MSFRGGDSSSGPSSSGPSSSELDSSSTSSSSEVDSSSRPSTSGAPFCIQGNQSFRRALLAASFGAGQSHGLIKAKKNADRQSFGIACSLSWRSPETSTTGGSLVSGGIPLPVSSTGGGSSGACASGIQDGDSKQSSELDLGDAEMNEDNPWWPVMVRLLEINPTVQDASYTRSRANRNASRQRRGQLTDWEEAMALYGNNTKK